MKKIYVCCLVFVSLSLQAVKYTTRAGVDRALVAEISSAREFEAIVRRYPYVVAFVV